MLQSQNDIQQTPFYIVKDHEKYALKEIVGPEHHFVLPTYDQNIQWDVILAKKMFPYEKFDIPHKKNRKIINQIINLFRNNQSFDLTFDDNKKLIQMLKQNMQIIRKYSNQKFPKAVIAEYLFTLNKNLKGNFQEIQSIKKLEAVCSETQYPLANVLLALELNKKGSNNKIIKSLLQKAVEYGETYAYQHYGYFLYIEKQYRQAYKLYKNSQKAGFVPIIYYRLGQVLASKEKKFRKNIIAAYKYFEKAKSSNIKPNTSLIMKMKDLQQQIKLGQIEAKKIVSTMQTQAKVVANFIKNKYLEAKIYTTIFKNTINRMLGGQCVCFVQKTFYVVCSPLMTKPSRGFLGQDEDGTIEAIYIYNWDQIHPNKLALLHKLGSKIIIKQYIRKYGVNCRLPMYRVENPFAVQFYPPTQRHFISNQKYREFAKCLYKNGYYQECKILYEHLITKKANDLQMIYCNMGLVYEKELNKSAAKTYYLKSLMIKDFDKSYFRLGKIFLEEGNTQQALKLWSKMKEQNGKKQLKRLIDQKITPQKQVTKQQFQHISLKKLKIISKNHQNFTAHILQGELSLYGPNSNKSVATVFQGNVSKYLLFWRQYLCAQLQIPQQISNQQYIKQLQSIYDAAELPLQHQNFKMIRNFFKFSYYQMRKYAGNLLYDQAYGYYKLYSKHFYSQPTEHYVGTQFTNGIAKRCNFLELKIQKQCIQLERNEKYSQAQQIYKCGNNNCIPFCVKIAQVKFKQGKYQQNIKYCNKVLTYLTMYPQNKQLLGYLVRTAILLQKSLQMLKKYKESIEEGQKILAFIDQNNTQYISMRVSTSRNYLFTQKQIFQSCNQNLNVCVLKKYISNSYHVLEKYDDALKYMGQKQLKVYREYDKQMYVPTLLLKIKIMKKQNINNGKAIQSIIQQILKSASVFKISNIYRIAMLKQILFLNIKQRNQERVIHFIVEIGKINSQFINVIIREIVRQVKEQSFLNSLVEAFSKLNYSQISKVLSLQIEAQKNKNLQVSEQINSYSEKLSAKLLQDNQDDLDKFVYITNFIYNNVKMIIYFSRKLGFVEKEQNLLQSIKYNQIQCFLQVKEGQKIYLKIEDEMILIGSKYVFNKTSYLMFTQKKHIENLQFQQNLQN